MNTDELDFAWYQAEERVREIQAKLYRWANEDSHRRFEDLFNLVCDPAPACGVGSRAEEQGCVHGRCGWADRLLHRDRA